MVVKLPQPVRMIQTEGALRPSTSGAGIIRRASRVLGWSVFSLSVLALILCVGAWVAPVDKAYLIRYDGKGGYWALYRDDLIFWRPELGKDFWRGLSVPEHSENRWARVLCKALEMERTEMELSWPHKTFYGSFSGLLGPSSGTMLIIPLWGPTAVLSLLPTVFAVRLVWRSALRWRRGRKGLCVCCGYVLRGLPARRCPECGQEF